MVLDVNNLSFHLGRQKIFEDLSFKARHGHIYGLFGPNGSGKTTFFNLLCGLHEPSSGEIVYYGKRPKNIDPLNISKIGGGLARTFQVPVVANELSVTDSLLLAFRFRDEGFSSLVYRGSGSKLQERAARSTISTYLDEFQLKSKSNVMAGALSYGERRLVSNLCAVLTGSQIVLLDEPFANLSSTNIETLKGLLRSLALKESRSIVLVEHRPDHLLSFVDVLVQLRDRRLVSYDIDPTAPQEFLGVIRNSAFQYE